MDHHGPDGVIYLIKNKIIFDDEKAVAASSEGNISRIDTAFRKIFQLQPGFVHIIKEIQRALGIAGQASDVSQDLGQLAFRDTGSKHPVFHPSSPLRTF